MERLSKQLPIIRPLSVASLFSALAGFVIASGISPVPLTDPPWTQLLPLGVIISVLVIVVVGLRLYRRQWLITPPAGILSTLASGIYSITSYTPGNCGGTSNLSGYPYPWFQTYALNECVIGRPLVAPPPPFHGQLFLVNAIFYTVVALAILELYIGLAQFSRKRSGIR